MTHDCFDAQIKRLRLRFGDKAFDPEFIALVGKEVAGMSNYAFEKIVEALIGSRSHNSPPLLVHFREMRLQLEKEAMTKTVSQADRALHDNKAHSLDKILESQGFHGCKTLHEAIEVQITKNRIAKADEGAV